MIMKAAEKLHQQIASQVQKNPEKTAIIETNTGESISYQDLFTAITRFRSYLGKEPQTILLALPGGILDAIIWLSALTGGHFLIPISPAATEYEYDDLIERHHPTLIITEVQDIRFSQHIKRLHPGECEEIIKNHSDDLFSLVDGRLYLSSSGSTGDPKGMILSLEQIVLTAGYIKESHHITENDRGLTPLPFHHVNAPVVSLMVSMLAGATVIIAPKFSTTNFWNWVETYDPTWISIVPTIVAMLLQTEKPDFLQDSSVRFVRTASAPLPAINLKRFEERFGLPVIETYGISEAASTITANPVPPAIHKAGSVGFPIGVQMRICTYGSDIKQIEDVAPGSVGEICIKGPNVITQYEKGAGKSSFVDGWFRTGDLGHFDEDGYLFITGRIKEVIIRGGENIAPREIEEILLTYPGIKDAAVVGQPDSIYGEKVVGFVVMDLVDKEMEKEIEKKIKEFAREKLSTLKIPERVYVLSELPKGKTGKIDKQSLKRFSQDL
jgi:acyl-CoA synthetase (AMP-forming)/AMP-acid ligase II